MSHSAMLVQSQSYLGVPPWTVTDAGGADQDRLMHLPGRVVAQQWLTGALSGGAAGDVGAMLLGFDQFKLIHTSLGRHAGDLLLVQVAQRLEEVLEAELRDHPDGHRAGAARYGGDQFVVVVRGLSSPTHLLELAERLSRELSEPFRIEGHEVCVRPSIGIVTHGRGYRHADHMLRDAETAMHRAAASPGLVDAGLTCQLHPPDSILCSGRVVVFDPQMHAQACRRMQVEQALRNAILQEQLTLNYQPIISYATGRIACFEVLLRWNDPQLGLVSPMEFIPVAEETGLILPLGAWALRRACRQLAQWRRDGFVDESVGISVNLSRVQMQQHDLVHMVRSAVQDAGLDIASGILHLEITESAIMADPPRAIDLLHALRAQGVNISMDDFGTQYSSLACLHQFPLNTLKIDRVFVRNLAERRDYAAVVHAIITLAHNLDIQVVAEGIETSEQVVQLLAMECDHAQGFHFARPMPADQAAHYMATYKPPSLGGDTEIMAA